MSLKTTATVITTVAYVAVCAGFLLMIFPGARHQLVRAWSEQRYRWKLGVVRRPPSSAWIALARTDLPDEPAA